MSSTRRKAELEILREAVLVGIADIEAGRFKEFANFDELDAYLQKIAEEEIGRTGGTAGGTADRKLSGQRRRRRRGPHTNRSA
jgi:hypothetical protein